MSSAVLLLSAPGPSHLLVVDDDPILHFALAQATHVDEADLVPLAADDEAALLHRPGTVGFEHRIPFTSVRTIAERLRWMVPRAPLVVFVADVAAAAQRCVEAGVPVFGVGESIDPRDDDRRFARLFIVDDGRGSLLPEPIPEPIPESIP